MPRLRERETKREGSPWKGISAVVTKELADHLSSVRMLILELLILATAGVTAYMALSNVSRTSGQEDFLFLKLFTTSQDPLPAFVGFLGFLVPLIAIALAFDAVNGEFSQRTLSRVLAQPIYRDALLLGKFLSGLLTLSMVLSAIWLVLMGLGIIGYGIPPSAEEVARSLVFLVVTIFYGGIWLGVGLIFSTVLRQPATAALASIATWLFFTIFWDIIASVFGRAIGPRPAITVDQLVAQGARIQALSRISPNTLFIEAMVGLLNPATRSFGLVLPSQLQGAIAGAPLPFGESLMLIWPHLTGMIAVTILLFAVSYVLFQRQEIRA
ncbi:MAG: ABC transporter permease [Anaerolineae bacterium]|nr:MAG: ABC transporter permease [Anaerolineae bacterium]